VLWQHTLDRPLAQRAARLLLDFVAFVQPEDRLEGFEGARNVGELLEGIGRRDECAGLLRNAHQQLLDVGSRRGIVVKLAQNPVGQRFERGDISGCRHGSRAR